MSAPRIPPARLVSISRMHYLHASEPLLPPISRTLARRVFYASCFFYASFFLHGWTIYGSSREPEPPAPRRIDTCLPGKGVLEPLLVALLPRDVASVTSAGGAK